MNQLDDFIRIRKLFAYGATRDYWDSAICVGWIREGDADHPSPVAVVVCTGDEDGVKRMQMPNEHIGRTFVDVLGWFQGELTVGEDVS